MYPPQKAAIHTTTTRRTCTALTSALPGLNPHTAGSAKKVASAAHPAAVCAQNSRHESRNASTPAAIRMTVRMKMRGVHHRRSQSGSSGNAASSYRMEEIRNQKNHGSRA